MPSIRGKIAFGYVGLTACVGAFALFVYGDLRYLERHIQQETAATALQEQTQEMRRHEKNFLLYRGGGDLDNADRIAGELMQLLAGGQGAPAREERQALTDGLDRYRRLIADYRADEIRGLKRFEGPLRLAGHEISSQVERIAQRERSTFEQTVQATQRALFVSMAVVAVLGILGAWLLARAVLAPLRRLELNLKPLAQGRFSAFPEVARDRELVSFTRALNRMLEELETRRRQVLQSEKLASLGILASGVAHELNNPLGNISAASQILIEENASADAAARGEWLKQIDAEAERAKRIVRTLLDYARRREFARATVALGEVVEKSLLLLHGRLPRGDTVDVAIPANLKVHADAQRLQQVFINLIRNAVDIGGPGVKIRIAARPAGAGDWPPAPTAHVVGAPRLGCPAVLVSISDDGPGFAAAVLPRVFDPFFTTREPGQGEGLGLYVVGEIIQEHEGCVAAETLPGGGARFSLWLPRRGDTP